MRKRNIILIVLGLLLVLGLVSIFFNNYLNTKKVKEFVQDQLPENIELEYKKLNTNVLFGNFTLDDAVVILKDKGIRIEVEELKLKGLNYHHLLISDTISITTSEIKKAYVLVDESKIDTTKFPRKEKRRDLFLKLKKFDVSFTGIELKDENGDLKAKLNATQLGLRDLMVNSSPKDSSDDLSFALDKIQSDSLQLAISATQEIFIGKAEIDRSLLKLTDTQLSLKDRGIEVNFDLLELSGKNLEHVFSQDSIAFDKCVLTQGNVKINNAKKQTQKTRKKIQTTNKVISIGKFNIVETAFEILDAQAKPKIKFDKTNAFFEDIKILTSPNDNENHFTYKFIHLDAKNLSAPMSDLHTFAIKDIQVDDKIAEFYDVSINPNYNRTEFQNHIKEEQDVLNLDVPKVVVDSYDFSFDKEQNFIAARSVALSSPVLSVYRNKLLPDQTARKPLYSEMLRDLNMELTIDKINLKKAKITYEEHVSANQKPGKIYFTQLNGVIQNLHNKKPKHDWVKLSLDANFMGHAPTHIDWDFHVHHPADNFRIKGFVKNLDAQSLDGFLVPNMKAKIDGNVQLTNFDFSGNDLKGTGHMDMTFDDLKVDLLNHKNEKKGFWSVIANFLVKTNKDKNAEANNIVSVERDQKKSFFNFFWLMLKDGVKQNVMKFQGKKDKA